MIFFTHLADDRVNMDPILFCCVHIVDTITCLQPLHKNIFLKKKHILREPPQPKFFQWRGMLWTTSWQQENETRASVSVPAIEEMNSRQKVQKWHTWEKRAGLSSFRPYSLIVPHCPACFSTPQMVDGHSCQKKKSKSRSRMDRCFWRKMCDTGVFGAKWPDGEKNRTGDS